MDTDDSTRRRGRGELPLLVLAAAALGAPFLLGRLPAGHDAYSYALMATETAANLREGILLPAWAPEANAGFGTPALLFYPPLLFVLSAPAIASGLSPLVVLGVGAVLLMAASGIAVRGWLRAAGWPTAALPAALVYMAAPYRLVDLYERCALAEHLAFVFPPLILWAAVAPGLSPRRRAALVALPAAALALSNLPQAVLFGLLLGVGWLLSGSSPRDRIALAAGGALGLAVAAFALLPAALAGRWVEGSQWYGAGSSLYRPATNTLFSSLAADRGFNTRVSTALVATVLLAAAAALAGAARRDPGGTRGWLAAALLALAAATPPAAILWERTPVLSQLQFPWRVAGPATLVLAALVARIPSSRRAFVIAAATTLLALPFWGRSTVEAGRLGPPPAAAPPGSVFPDPRAVHAAAATVSHPNLENPGYREIWFLPRGVPFPAFYRAIADENPPSPMGEIRHRAAAVRAVPEATVAVERWSRRQRSVTVATPRAGRLVLHTLPFAGLSVFVDDERVAATPEPGTGLASLDLPAGTHRVAWGWHRPAPLPIADAASGAALLLVLFAVILPERRTP